MSYRIILSLALLLVLSLCARADGLAFGKGFTPQLRETHQLAVINLTENTADVAMFIAIENIPEGKEITYILPFWYQPEGFTMTEGKAEDYRSASVYPAELALARMNRISSREGSERILKLAKLSVAGLPWFFGILDPDSMESRMHAGATENAEAPAPAPLTPYEVQTTRHARAELYKIGGDDLQKLVAQSGLPAKYLAPLKKYHTPYFAVMRLTGVKKSTSQAFAYDAKGVTYHFTHALSGGRYFYPLGTGAAWPQPIPSTEVYLTCPDRLAMQVDAPVEGETLKWDRFAHHAGVLSEYLSLSPKEKQKFGENDSSYEDYLTPYTGSRSQFATKSPFAWHIAYLQSNPDKDISVQLRPRATSWRLSLADRLAQPPFPLLIAIVCYVLGWLFTFRFVIYRRWVQAGRPETFLRHAATTFVLASLLGAAIWLVLVGLFNNIGSFPVVHKDDEIYLSVYFSGLLCAATVAYFYARYFKDWRKWLTVTSWFTSSAIYVLGILAAYAVIHWCETL